MIRIFFFLLFVTTLGTRCTDSPAPIIFGATSIEIDGTVAQTNFLVSSNPNIKITFSLPLDRTAFLGSINLSNPVGEKIEVNVSFEKKDSVVILTPKIPLQSFTNYGLLIDNTCKSAFGDFLGSAILITMRTKLDDVTDKFPQISDEALLDKVQAQTFKYFWDFGHPTSGLARERNSSGDLVTSGGSGFGVMSIIVGIERGFISRAEGLGRLLKISDFLLNKADRFHGVYPHWLNGVNGKTIPFSAKDNGGDIVETSFLIAGLLCASEYFDQNNFNESQLRQEIKEIWETVEWNWHTKGTENVLYWHWSPNFGWEMNHKLKGWNEALITYVLAASSPTYPIGKSTYSIGWASNGSMKNGKSYYSHTLPLGPDKGGPLFFSHYSFLGLDPRNLQDNYASYWDQCVNHTLINYDYCVENPKRFQLYGPNCWGLTASDNYAGYNAHSPTNDLGVISPTAAISSMPYTPNQSMAAIRYFYYKLGDKIFKEYGFVDAFSPDKSWIANSFLAIDQGPMIVMMENHRSQLIWKTLMKNKDVQNGLLTLGFTF